MQKLLWRIFDDFEIVIESASHLSHHDESTIFITEVLLFSDEHVFRHVTARLLWLVNTVTNFVMEVTATWRRARWQLTWLDSTLATDAVCCHASCWHGSVPRWTLTWIRAPKQLRVAIWLVHMSVVWFVHVSWSSLSMCRYLISPCVVIWLVIKILWRNLIRSCIGQNISKLMAFIYIYTTHSKFSLTCPRGNNYIAQWQ
jgi:hypothetical protein